MKKIFVLMLLGIMTFVSGTSVWAAGDKVRGECGQGAVNQVDADSQDNQA